MCNKKVADLPCGQFARSKIVSLHNREFARFRHQVFRDLAHCTPNRKGVDARQERQARDIAEDP
jgi:hypothetical protein